MLFDGFLDGDEDLLVDGFVPFEGFDDGAVDDGPEFDLGGRVSGVGWGRG